MHAGILTSNPAGVEEVRMPKVRSGAESLPTSDSNSRRHARRNAESAGHSAG